MIINDSHGCSVADATWRSTITTEMNDRPLPVRMRLGNVQSRIVSGPDGMPRPTAIGTFQMATIATISAVNLMLSIFRTRVR